MRPWVRFWSFSAACFWPRTELGDVLLVALPSGGPGGGKHGWRPPKSPDLLSSGPAAWPLEAPKLASGAGRRRWPHTAGRRPISWVSEDKAGNPLIPVHAAARSHGLYPPADGCTDGLSPTDHRHLLDRSGGARCPCRLGHPSLPRRVSVPSLQWRRSDRLSWRAKPPSGPPTHVPREQIDQLPLDLPIASPGRDELRQSRRQGGLLDAGHL